LGLNLNEKVNISITTKCICHWKKQVCWRVRWWHGIIQSTKDILSLSLI